MINSAHTLKAFWKRVLALASQKNIFFNASAITFNLFICAIPFVLILTSIIGHILSFDEAFDEIVRYGSELIPILIIKPPKLTLFKKHRHSRVYYSF